MFDRYDIQTGPQHVTVDHRVTEVRAPTDQSVALLKEMESAARDKVTESLRLPSNEFHAQLHKQVDHLDGTTKFLVVYDINGKRVETRYDHVRELKHPTDAVNQLIEALAKDIAREILGPCARDLFRRY